MRSAELAPAEWAALTELCVAAFDEPWDDYWSNIGPGVHVLAEHPERGIVAHAAIVDRLLYPGDLTLRAGYVEAVAVWPVPRPWPERCHSHSHAVAPMGAL